jgi:uncharacterized protein
VSGSDFQVSLRDLKRTQGAHKSFRVEGTYAVVAAAGLAVLPAGRLVVAEGTLEAVGDGVLVTAIAQAEVDAQCSRCLTPFVTPAEVAVQELFVYDDRVDEFDDEDVLPIVGDQIDLADAIRDAILLDQPLIPLCREDCRGLCPRCGADLNTTPDHQHAGVVDDNPLARALADARRRG